MVSKALLRSLLGICLIFGFTTMGCEEPADDDDTTGDDDDTTGDDDDTTGDDDDTTGDDDDTAGTDADGDGYTDDVDCDDNNADVHPDADEGCDGIDTDCDGAPAADEVDDDADGYMICDGDCDDGNVDIYPGAAEACNGIDDDCDGAAGADEVDADADGFMICDGDCDDADGAVYPGAVEVCNTIDDNCDGTVDEGSSVIFYAEADGDTYGDINSTLEDCAAPSGYVADSTDCDDADAAVNPAAVEVCNAIDDNCDGNIDEGVLLTFYADADGDTYGDDATTVDDCAAPSGYVVDGGDCDDADATINPGATEDCDGVDNNCDGFIDGTLAEFDDDDDDAIVSYTTISLYVDVARQTPEVALGGRGRHPRARRHRRLPRYHPHLRRRPGRVPDQPVRNDRRAVHRHRQQRRRFHRHRAGRRGGRRHRRLRRLSQRTVHRQLAARGLTVRFRRRRSHRHLDAGDHRRRGRRRGYQSTTGRYPSPAAPAR